MPSKKDLRWTQPRKSLLSQNYYTSDNFLTFLWGLTVFCLSEIFSFVFDLLSQRDWKFPFEFLCLSLVLVILSDQTSNAFTYFFACKPHPYPQSISRVILNTFRLLPKRYQRTDPGILSSWPPDMLQVHSSVPQNFTLLRTQLPITGDPTARIVVVLAGI